MLSIYPLEYSVPPMRRVKVKICGIMLPQHAHVAARSGADMIGVLFAQSKRQVTIEAALAIRAVLGNSPTRPLLVGVFVNDTPRHMLDVAQRAHLDIVQLSGDETPETVARCAERMEVIKALRFPVGTPHEHALDLLDSYSGCSRTNRVRVLVDAYHPLEYGGTGQVADWSLAARLAERHNVILAGGLTAANVRSATKQVLPWGVDVSSGVERNGAKDPQLIKAFADAARSYL
jgi:phosphoribosylanthranilate isomerase